MVFQTTGEIDIAGWEVSVGDASTLVLAFAVVLLIGLVLYLFFRTNLGTAMRATGENDQMIRSTCWIGPITEVLAEGK